MAVLIPVAQMHPRVNAPISNVYIADYPLFGGGMKLALASLSEQALSCASTESFIDKVTRRDPIFMSLEQCTMDTIDVFGSLAFVLSEIGEWSVVGTLSDCPFTAINIYTITDNELTKYAPRDSSGEFTPTVRYMQDIDDLEFSGTDKIISGALAGFLTSSPLTVANNSITWRYFDLNKRMYTEYKLPATTWKGLTTVKLKAPEGSSRGLIEALYFLNKVSRGLKTTFKGIQDFGKSYTGFIQSTQRLTITQKPTTTFVDSIGVKPFSPIESIPGRKIYSAALMHTACLLSYMYYLFIGSATLQVKVDEELVALANSDTEVNADTTRALIGIRGTASYLLNTAKGIYGSLLVAMKYLVVPSPYSLPEFSKCHRFSLVDDDLAKLDENGYLDTLDSLVDSLRAGDQRE